MPCRAGGQPWAGGQATGSSAEKATARGARGGMFCPCYYIQSLHRGDRELAAGRIYFQRSQGGSVVASPPSGRQRCFPEPSGRWQQPALATRLTKAPLSWGHMAAGTCTVMEGGVARHTRRGGGSRVAMFVCHGGAATARREKMSLITSQTAFAAAKVTADYVC